MTNPIFRSHPFFASHTAIAVAVGFDRQSEGLVQVGAALARKLQKRLVLIHITDGWVDRARTEALSPRSPLWDVLPSLETSIHERARARLQEFADVAAKGLETEIVVRPGSPAEILWREASARDACLLIVGAGITGYSMLANAPVPVMAFDPAKATPEIGSGMRVLVADDLSDESEAAVAFSAALGDSCGKTWLHHVHVSAFDRETMGTALAHAAATAHTALGQAEVGSVFDAVRAEQLKRLQDRFGDDREYLEANGGRYTAEVIGGGVRPELSSVVESFDPDIVVFGRHRTVHSKPFSFGRMPYRAMLKLDHPIIVVPSL